MAMKIEINLNGVIPPLAGSWTADPGLTEQVPCDNVTCDAMTGEGEFRCENIVWINPEWRLSHERLWPVHVPPVYCPNCYP